MREEDFARRVRGPQHVRQTHLEMIRLSDPLGQICLFVLPGERQVVPLLHERDDALHAALFRVPFPVWREVHRSLQHEGGILLKVPV